MKFKKHLIFLAILFFEPCFGESSRTGEDRLDKSSTVSSIIKKLTGAGMVLGKIKLDPSVVPSEDSFTVVAEDSFKYLQTTFERGLKISYARCDSFDEPNLFISSDKKPIQFRGASCRSIVLAYGNLVSCQLTENFQFAGGTIPKESEVYFNKDLDKTSPPGIAFIQELGEKAKIYHTLYPKGTTLKLENNKASERFMPSELVERCSEAKSDVICDEKGENCRVMGH